MKSARQSGATLISLMVGMVVSMLAILASISMFHDLVRTAAEAKTDARHEGDISLAVLRLDQEILSAGFDMGRAPTDNKNLDFLAQPEDKVAAPGESRMAWRYKNGAQYVCKRALSRRDTDTYVLELFEMKLGDCTKDTDLAAEIIKNDKWVTPAEELARVQLQDLQKAIAFKSPLITFDTTADGACAPFGAAPQVVAPAVAPKHPLVQLNAFDPAMVYSFDAGAPPMPRPHTICLINIVVP
ncbi:MAG: hypothetical protein U1F46_01350 [Marinagarivorans sp.]